MKSFLTILTLSIMFQTQVFAVDNLSMIPTNKEFSLKTTPIYNQNEIIKEVKDFVEIPVLFPTIIKGEVGHLYFASTDLQDNYNQKNPKGFYLITIGSVPGCSAHYCTIGSLTADSHGKLNPSYDTLKAEGAKSEALKIPVTLSNDIKGYYTPGHAGASYFDDQVEWTYKDVLYTISWRGADQEDLIQMANSAISPVK